MNKLFLLQTLSPLHIGTGQSLGTTDLPIAREKATGWPVVPGSSIKGVVKDHHKSRLLNGSERTADEGAKLDKELAHLYGSPDSHNASAGMVTFADAKCLFFPVRSFKGTVACITCPLALSRLSALLSACESTISLPPFTVSDGCAVIHQGSPLLYEEKLLLEEMDMDAEQKDLSSLHKLIPDYLKDHIAVLSDTDFTHFTESATEVVTHVSINFGTKTAREGFLRSEERVPSEATFFGLLRLDASVGADRLSKAHDEIKALDKQMLQFGGKASTGSGLCKWAFIAEGDNQ